MVKINCTTHDGPVVAAFAFVDCGVPRLEGLLPKATIEMQQSWQLSLIVKKQRN